AVGYDYSVEKGPKVTGVELPTGVGDDMYDLWAYNEQADTYMDSGVDIEGGALYQFNEPVSRFSIRGIENSAGLDPNNETAFPTGLRFEKTGRAIVNMTSIENEM
ncbi:MAG: nidogen, partial [Candidatus Electrothrix sp. AUS1_2]|nr:nidogen [Candidatus Electrothrix sp. AUS1_2]